MPDDSLSLLHRYAQAAEVHAAEEYGFGRAAATTGTIVLSVQALDWIMNVERSKFSDHSQNASSGQASDSFNPVIDDLTLCYGAWFGFHIVECFPGAQWVGLDEPLPPRILLHGLAYSPIDAVRRLLISHTAPTLAILWRQLLESHRSIGNVNSAESLNRKAWDDLVRDPRFLANDDLPRDPAAARSALDPWLVAEGDLSGKRILCLAAGGGKHGPLYALTGAKVTVLDFSQRHLDRDVELAKQFDVPLETVCLSLNELASWETEPFDIVLQPVSLCYIADCQSVYQAIADRLRPSGLYISQNKHPASLQASESIAAPYSLDYPYADGFALPIIQQPTAAREPCVVEHIHSLNSLIGGLCRAGFFIEDFSEPLYGDAWSSSNSPNHRHLYLPPYFKLKARKR
jgi:2-polyprenyl-3-methyl-5-hydroxy-6-metoxy-1,4-benzoquinol methylase